MLASRALACSLFEDSLLGNVLQEATPYHKNDLHKIPLSHYHRYLPTKSLICSIISNILYLMHINSSIIPYRETHVKSLVSICARRDSKQ